jgi:DNA helicase HerA-like ATPase
MPAKKAEDLAAFYQKAYALKGTPVVLGAVVHEGQVEPQAPVQLALSMFNRHGLVAGATGTGKTKSLQLLAELLSAEGVPSLIMDVKGDLSGVGQAGESNEKIAARHKALGIAWKAAAAPVEYLSLSGDEPGVRLRATVAEFGPDLLGRLLELNETQSSVLAVLFGYCDGHGLPILDLKDLKAVLAWAGDEGAAELAKSAGAVSGATLGTIQRKVSALEAAGAGRLFGEPSFEVKDLMKRDADGRGVVNVLRLADVQDKPQLYSTFMLSLLAEVYHTLPERGDADAPELVIMIDEAHLLFAEAPTALLKQIETMVKLIRSKGVGLFFCTQVPGDVPESVLSQLGLKVQHALRAFTAKDRQALKLAAQNYPDAPFYDNEELLTQVGIGEAAVSGLDEKGNPTPVAHVMLRAPGSRMGVVTAAELKAAASKSKLVAKYAEDLDADSAAERLAKKLAQAQAQEAEAAQAKAESKAAASVGRGRQSYAESLAKSAGRTVLNMAVRGLFNALLKSAKR